jgi:hypothetical protein
MARLRVLLALSRASDQRLSETARSGAEKLLEFCVVVGASFVLLHQLGAIATGPSNYRLRAAYFVVIVLCALWALIPLSIRPTISVESLRLYPLTTRQQLAFHVLSYLQNRRLLALLAASFAVVITLIRVPNPLSHMAKAAASLVAATVFGFILATLLRPSVVGVSFQRLSRQTPTSKAYPLVRKELRYFSRTLDPYVAIFIALAAGYSEYLAAWMTPAMAMLPLLLVAIVQLPLVLNPFGLDTLHERERYRLLPMSPQKILLQKHIALVLLFLATLIPLAGSLFHRMPLQQSSITALLIVVVLLCWLCTGLVLMRLPASQTVRLAFGTLSGDGMSILLALQAVALLLSLPMILGMSFARAGSSGFRAATLLALASLVLAYGRMIRLVNKVE